MMDEILTAPFTRYMRYTNSYEAFAKEMFDLSEVAAWDDADGEVIARDADTIARIVWLLVTHCDRNVLVATPTINQRGYWHTWIVRSIERVRSELGSSKPFVSASGISMRNGNRLMFTSYNSQYLRGLTIQNLFLLHSEIVPARQFVDMYQSAVPAVCAASGHIIRVVEKI